MAANQVVFLSKRDLLYLQDALSNDLTFTKAMTIDHSKLDVPLIGWPEKEGMVCVAWARIRMEKYVYLFIGVRE